MEYKYFKKLHQFLDELGFPKVEKKEVKIIRTDFEKAFKKGKIDFDGDFIGYTDDEGVRHQGYMFIREFGISYNTDSETFPKAHIKKCSTIQSFLNNGKFEKRYEWSNDRTNDLIDIRSKNRKEYKNVKLDFCQNCIRERNKSAFAIRRDDLNDTEDFFKLITKLKQKPKKTHVKVGLDGYTFDFQNISKKYRESKNYICERCGKKPKSPRDRYYWHTHHKDGNKINNYTYNFECLCIACHAKVDKTHEKNFNKNKKRELEYFLENYG